MENATRLQCRQPDSLNVRYGVKFLPERPREAYEIVEENGKIISKALIPNSELKLSCRSAVQEATGARRESWVPALGTILRLPVNRRRRAESSLPRRAPRRRAGRGDDRPPGNPTTWRSPKPSCAADAAFPAKRGMELHGTES